MNTLGFGIGIFLFLMLFLVFCLVRYKYFSDYMRRKSIAFDLEKKETEQKINQGARLTTHRLHLTQE